MERCPRCGAEVNECSVDELERHGMLAGQRGARGGDGRYVKVATCSKAPSVAQARNRMNDGHRAVLAMVAEGRAVASTARPSEVRGYLTCYRTLTGWGAIDAEGKLTDFGRALLAR